MPRDFSPLRKTGFDLYLERERLPWYFRTIATVSSWFALGGYILFALVFTSPAENLRTTRSALTGLAGTLLVLGYVAISAIAFSSKSILFQFDCVLLPILTSSVLGIFVTVMNHALRLKFPIPTDAYIYVPLVTACATTIASGILSYLFWRRLKRIMASDNRRRAPPRHTRSTSYGDAASTTELLPMQIPEDEAQRQQLLRLLLSRESARAPSPDSATYKIDLPSPDARGREHQYLAVPLHEGRTRGDSLPSTTQRWNLGNLLPNRGRSPGADTFKDPRERRREEIERGPSQYTSPPKFGSETWPGYVSDSPLPTPPVGYPMRYA